MQLRIFDAAPISVVGVDAHIDPAGCTAFYENLRRIRNFPLSGQSRRPLRRDFDAFVHRRDGRLCPPAGYIGFTDIFGETATSQRADVGIGPYRTPANPYFLASFERKAFLQQILNRSYSQIWCTITGGAYQIARRVSPCVRNGYKTGASLNCTRSTHQTVTSAPFLPILFRKDGKEWAAGGSSNRFAGFAGNLWCRQNKPLVMRFRRHDKGQCWSMKP